MTKEEILAWEFYQLQYAVWQAFGISVKDKEDILAAWQVVEKIRNGDAMGDFVSWLMRPELLDIHPMLTAYDTVHKMFEVTPEAICKAALLAKGCAGSV